MRAKKTATLHRQEQIAETALELIGSEGINSLSITAIAQRVGIVPSALYRHYKSKEGVLDAVLVIIDKRLREKVRKSRIESSDALEALKLLMMRHAGMLQKSRAIPLVIFSDGLYAQNPKRRLSVDLIINRYLNSIEDIIKEGKADSLIRDEIDPQTTAVMFLGMILPAAVLLNISEGRFDIVQHVKKAWPLFKRSIATKCES